MEDTNLTPRQQAFVEHYVECLNASEAARRAGYSEKTAGQIGDDLLKKVQIAEAIAKARQERSERTRVTADRVVRELAFVAFSDIGKVMTPDGTLKPVHEIDEETRRAIVDISDSPRRVKLADKLRALDLLGRHLGMWADKLTLRSDPENPVSALIMSIQGSSLPVVHKEHEGE